jgi:hypothetical protein
MAPVLEIMDDPLYCCTTTTTTTTTTTATTTTTLNQPAAADNTRLPHIMQSLNNLQNSQTKRTPTMAIFSPKQDGRL